MFDANVPRVLERIGPGSVVLDVGGWARPFNRADHVLDSGPYDTRGRWYAEHFGLSAQGGAAERFTAATWVTRDICDRTPWPYADRAIDYCICSHTLEDVRDPLGVCSEMVRVAKAGYIEVPSRLFEQCRGREAGIVGLSHHRWLVEIDGSHVRFLPKFHSIHADYRLSFPASFARRMTSEQEVTWLFWQGSFRFEEVTIHGIDAQRAELARFVAERYQHPAARRAWESARRGAAWTARLPGRAARKLGRGLRAVRGSTGGAG
jgi:hypothetical protein